MQFELEITLENSFQQINLQDLQKNTLLKPRYQIQIFSPDDYLLIFDTIEGIYYRIHKDGRIGATSINDLKPIVITKLNKTIWQFVKENFSMEELAFKKEIKIYLKGKNAKNLFWAKYGEIKSIGEKTLKKFRIQTYSLYENTYFVKLSACS